MRVAVIGSRTITDIGISEFIPSTISMLISGGAKGIDTLAENYADEQGVPKIIIKPDYKRYGKKAPLVRDKDIVDMAECVIAIWDGLSRGTKYTVDYAKRQGKTVRVYRLDNQ